LLKLVNYRFGNPTCNLEHRRVNLESRQLRVERKALVSCPTLNERLSLSKNYSRNSAPRSCRNRSRILACAAVTSSLVSVRLWLRYVNRYATDFFLLRIIRSPLSPTTRSKNSPLLRKASFC